MPAKLLLGLVEHAHHLEVPLLQLRHFRAQLIVRLYILAQLRRQILVLLG